MAESDLDDATGIRNIDKSRAERIISLMGTAVLNGEELDKVSILVEQNQDVMNLTGDSLIPTNVV